ncbi:type II/IV secretion system protein, partial [bacterium LRH843]|nr:type II/IV secretion system protein [bacterium LRH843]
RLCNHCKEEYEPSNEEKRLLGVEGKRVRLFHHKGCDKCYHSGYKGRIAVHEILPIDKGMDDLIATGATRKQIVDYAMQQGF